MISLSESGSSLLFLNLYLLILSASFFSLNIFCLLKFWPNNKYKINPIPGNAISIISQAHVVVGSFLSININDSADNKFNKKNE